jgi:anti-anti-sigma factor
MGTGNFKVSQDADGTFLLQGELTIHDLEYFKDLVDSAFSRAKTLSLSFEDLAFLDTASLQFLLSYKKSLGKGRSWVIRGVSPEVSKILEVSGTRKYLVPGEKGTETIASRQKLPDTKPAEPENSESRG